MPLYRRAVSGCDAPLTDATPVVRPLPDDAISALEAEFCRWLRDRYGLPGIDFVPCRPDERADAVLAISPAREVIRSLAA